MDCDNSLPIIENPDEKTIVDSYYNTNPLNIKYYQGENFNNIRRCKLLLFNHCLGDNKVFNDKCAKIINESKITDEDLLIKFSKEYVCEQLEKGCLNRSIKKAKEYNIRCIWSNPNFIDIYHSICYKLTINIDINSSIKSDYIINKIINQDIDLTDMANMKSKDLCPEKYIQIDEKMFKRTNLKRKIKFSELYRCRKCKRNQTTTERRYNRSLDEGVNLTIKCLFCGNTWGG
jgi:DNA-directed RNA polymerase subunit M/transcription elongation factor TFIIS